MSSSCFMCLMPFSKDKGKREADNYCSHCFKNGGLSYKGADVNEFRKMRYKKMVENGIPKLLARFYSFMILFAPHWKKQK